MARKKGWDIFIIIFLRFIYCGKIDLTNLLGFEKFLITELWNFYLDRICEEPLMLFNSDKFINLNTPLLELLLNRDDLNLDEIIVWNNLIKWCLAQHSNVPQGRRFSVSGYARIGSRTDEEFVSKEDLATARLYFKRPGHIRRLFLDNWTHRTSGLEVYTVINSKHNIF
ncbi:unnamed protein product [Rhizophagus irregularis]|nr:unnamed protein product [Rhizophagus irregularis]